MTIIKRINEKNISLEEAEEKACITKGTILETIKGNKMLPAKVGFDIFNALLK